MSSTALGRVSLALTVCALGGLLSAHAADCCRTYFEFWSGGSETPPCQAPSVKVCEIGVPDDNGRLFSDHSLGVCHTYVVTALQVYWGPCGTQPDGWQHVGPPVPVEGGAMCCYIHPDILPQVTGTQSLIAHCFGQFCVDGEPVED